MASVYGLTSATIDDGDRMRLWMGAEVDADVGESFRVLRNEIEKRANDSLASIDYGDAIAKWAHISIIRQVEGDAFPEIVKYDKRRKVAEYRLKIDHRLFRDGDAQRKRKLVCESLVRSISMCGELKVNHFECERFLRDFTDVCQGNGWL
jgi:hypothetical protein